MNETGVGLRISPSSNGFDRRRFRLPAWSRGKASRISRPFARSSATRGSYRSERRHTARREFFKLKHRLLEFCVAELGFTTFIIEASFPESLAVNAYVLNGVGNAADALAGMRFWTWDTEEVLDLIEWMRWWNGNNRRQVKFYGYAMAYPAVAAQGLIDFLARVAPELAAACRTELAPLTSDFTAALFGQLPDTSREAMFACIARMLAAFAQQRSRWIAATSAIDWHLGRLHAIVLDQARDLRLIGARVSRTRGGGKCVRPAGGGRARCESRAVVA